MNLLQSFLESPQIINLDWDCMELIGEDSWNYLHGQSTNNLYTDHIALNAVTDVRGRLEAYFLQFYDNDRLYLFTPSWLAQELKNRLEKYCISEDMEIVDSDLKLRLQSFHDLGQRFKGFDEAFSAIIGHADNGKSADQFLRLLGLPGAKFLEKKPLFTDTVLIDYAFDNNKGCFPGQEVISKVVTRRGPAYGMAYLEIDHELQKGELLRNGEGKKIGEISDFFEGAFYLVSLLREYRVEGAETDFFVRDLTFKSKVRVLSELPLSFDKRSEYLYERALEEHSQNEHLDLAVALLENLLSINPKLIDAWEVLSVIYGKQGKYDLAVETAKKQLVHDPDSVMAHTNLSFFYMRQGKIEEAEEEKAQATVASFKQLGKESEAKKLKEQQDEQAKKDIARKEEMFKQVLEIDPNDDLANLGLAEVYFLKGDYQIAAECLEQFYQKDKRSSKLYLILSKSLIHLGKFDRALDLLKEGSQWSAKAGELQPANEMQSLIAQYEDWSNA